MTIQPPFGRIQSDLLPQSKEERDELLKEVIDVGDEDHFDNVDAYQEHKDEAIHNLQ